MAVSAHADLKWPKWSKKAAKLVKVQVLYKTGHRELNFPLNIKCSLIQSLLTSRSFCYFFADFTEAGYVNS